MGCSAQHCAVIHDIYTLTEKVGTLVQKIGTGVVTVCKLITLSGTGDWYCVNSLGQGVVHYQYNESWKPSWVTPLKKGETSRKVARCPHLLKT